VLQVTAERLSAKLGEAGVARLGGDEFGILLDDAQSTVGVSARIEALKSCWSEPILIDGRQLRVGLSTGVSLYPEDGGTPEILFSASDAALHHAKEEEPGGVRFFTPAMNERAVGRLDLLAALEQALEREEFRVFYQPVVELELLEFASMEALVRWQRPDVGLVYPGAFIELAEETGLEVAIGSWVLTQAGRDIASWRSEGLAPPRVAINLSARQLRDPRLRSNVVKALMQARVPPSAISLELTERNLMDDSMVEVLDSLRSLGIRLAVDDFGTGYSSLGYLQRFPLDILKVDRSFVKDVATDAQAATITRACIAMAHELGLQVIAEGVETEEQLAFLRECKCDYAQGFLFSEAVPAEEIRKMLVRGEIG
jgi:EAL domain-containing protein (putative c-di-GMP-specific phosphodiesterase class I)